MLLRDNQARALIFLRTSSLVSVLASWERSRARHVGTYKREHNGQVIFEVEGECMVREGQETRFFQK